MRWWGVAMAVGSAPEAIDTVASRGGDWRLSYLVLFHHPEANPEATAVYSRSRARARHPTCFSWRSGPTQSQLGASSLAYRRTAIMRRAFLWSGTLDIVCHKSLPRNLSVIAAIVRRAQLLAFRKFSWHHVGERVEGALRAAAKSGNAVAAR